MSPTPTARTAARERGADPYQRHRPEQTLLYRIVDEHYPQFVDLMDRQGLPLPDYVQREFEDYLRCGRQEQGFLRVRCDTCHAERLVAFSCRRRCLLRASYPPPFAAAFGCANRQSCRFVNIDIEGGLNEGENSCPVPLDFRKGALYSADDEKGVDWADVLAGQGVYGFPNPAVWKAA